MGRIRDFFRRESTTAFLLYTLFYAVLAAFVLWGSWPLDRSLIQPDHNMVFPPDMAARFARGVAGGGAFIPSDIHWFIGSPYWWAELEYAVPCWLAGLAVFFYLRGRGLGRLAGYGAGLAFALSGYSFTLFSAGHMGWFEFITYGIFAFGLVDRAVRKGSWRNWALLGAVLAWGSARQQDLWMLFTLLAAFYGAWCVVREAMAGGLSMRGGVGTRGTAARLGAGLALCMLVAAAIGTPMFVNAFSQSLSGRREQIKDVSKATGVDTENPEEMEKAQWEFVTNWSMPPEDVLEFVAAGVRGDSSDPRVSPSRPYWGRLGRPVDEKFVAGKVMPNYRQHSLYVGAITVVLALFGVFGWFCGGRSRKSDVPFWIAAAVVCTILAMGRFTPLYRLVYAVPLLDNVRAPVKFHHLTELCLAVLSGCGIAVAVGGAEHARARRLAAIASCVLSLALFATAIALNAGSAETAGEIAKLGIARTREICASLASGMVVSTVVAGVVCAVAALAVWFSARRSSRLATLAVVVLVAANALMLAVNDRRYCEPVDITFSRGPNAAAKEIVARGGGKFVDLTARGLGDSMCVNGATEGASEADDKSVRFMLVPAAAEQHPNLTAFLRSRHAQLVGCYRQDRVGFSNVERGRHDFSLYEFGDWVKEEEMPRKIGLLSAISVLSTFLMLGWAVKYTKSSH